MAKLTYSIRLNLQALGIVRWFDLIVYNLSLHHCIITVSVLLKTVLL